LIKRHRALLGLVIGIGICVPAAALQPSRGKRALFGQPITDFAARRAALRAAVKDGIILIFGPGEDSDISWTRFRTDNDLMYLTGVEAPGACLALLPAGDPTGKREILFLSEDAGGGVWTDRLPVPGHDAEQLTGIETTRPSSQIWSVLKPSIEKVDTVHLPGSVGEASESLPEGGGVTLAARYYETAAAEEAIKKIHPGITIEGQIERYVHKLRWRKSAAEIGNLRAAIAATGAAERAAGKAVRDGANELAIEGVILAAFRTGGAVREGFPCIVGSGPNSTVLHHFSSSRVMRYGEVVVIDIGAEYNYYTADITRTFPVSGRFTPRQRELYQLVLDTQKAAERYLKPGVTTRDELSRYASEFLRKSPLRAKDSRGTLRTMDRFFPHGLGHWLGMNVHDVGSGSTILMPGTVITIEPGVYIPSEGIGFRIEDDYLVTETGVEKLSKTIPSEVEEVEALMRGSAPPAPRSNRTRPVRLHRPSGAAAVLQTARSLPQSR
jgi:Xaa-Pro aminopeptidase